MKQNIAITTDAVVFAQENNEIFLLVIQRRNPPDQGKWALPGGFLEENELLVEGCLRELKEETGLVLSKIEKVGIYDAVYRDPRGRTITVAYTSLLQERLPIEANDDAAQTEWVSVNNLKSLAFDHSEIIEDALKKMNIIL
ncbi:NUDIX hydrolase [Mesonia sp. K7]|uniref:NUDIX domain-containing protein n=1 Tax=Mesonia sp. K7 TaxID=2218606 RepID=UPI000DA7ED9F|nr:NUDIX hydrolase [Mesonia sp. K7]PZD79324.1 NUDIX hydrolase [Mesonia sp. K7]